MWVIILSCRVFKRKLKYKRRAQKIKSSKQSSNTLSKQKMCFVKVNRLKIKFRPLVGKRQLLWINKVRLWPSANRIKPKRLIFGSRLNPI